MSSRADNRRAGGVRKQISTYCYQCINGPDLLTVEVVDGIATEIHPNVSVRGLHPADGKICVKPFRPMKRHTVVDFGPIEGKQIVEKLAAVLTSPLTNPPWPGKSSLLSHTSGDLL
jgi:hypothetical protein